MKLAMLIAEGFETSEALVTLDILRRGNIHVDLVSITNEQTKKSSHHVSIVCDKILSEIKQETYEGIILPGGLPGVTHLEASTEVLSWILNFYQQDKYLFAICAAPAILLKLGCLDGLPYTCYPGCEIDHSKAFYQPNHNVVVNQKIITAQAMGSSIDFGLSILAKVGSNEISEKVKNSIFY